MDEVAVRRRLVDREDVMLLKLPPLLCILVLPRGREGEGGEGRRGERGGWRKKCAPFPSAACDTTLRCRSQGLGASCCWSFLLSFASLSCRQLRIFNSLGPVVSSFEPSMDALIFKAVEASSPPLHPCPVARSGHSTLCELVGDTTPWSMSGRDCGYKPVYDNQSDFT